jgi:hypothetical protein
LTAAINLENAWLRNGQEQDADPSNDEALPRMVEVVSLPDPSVAVAGREVRNVRRAIRAMRSG